MCTSAAHRLRVRIAPLALLALAACASRATPLDLPPGHPADPGTAAAPARVDDGPTSPHGPAAVPAIADHAHITYACPMHPDVRSSEPGTCPKCGMNLVPVKHPAAAEPGNGEHR